jgi:hypothetical protein
MSNIDKYGVNTDRPDYEEIKRKMDEHYKPYNDLGKAIDDLIAAFNNSWLFRFLKMQLPNK